MNHDHYIYCWVVIILLFSCSGGNKKTITEEEYDSTREALVGANRILVKKDYERIKSFVERKGWNMVETSSGLWYQIVEKGDGKPAEKDLLVSFAYTLTLLDGTLIYDSDSTGLKRFRIGSGGVETGLEEGVLLLGVGDKARFIIPPHLAHGLTGDGNKIPPRAIIVYDIAIVSLDE